MKRRIFDKQPDPPGGGFAVLYLFLYALVGAVAIFGTARQLSAGELYLSGAWALYGGLLLWAVRYGQTVHERALVPYLEHEMEPARVRPAPVTIKSWSVAADGRSARPVEHDSRVPDAVWHAAAELARANEPITRARVTSNGDHYNLFRQELDALGYLESGQISAAGLAWLAAMGQPAERSNYRPIATPELRSARSSSSSSGNPRSDRTRPAANGRGQGGWSRFSSVAVMSWQTADDWPWLVVGTVAVAIVFLFLRVFEQTHGYERAANLAVGLILAGGILFLLGWWMNGGGW